MTMKVVCLAGDGIGPEVTASMKLVVGATGVPIDWIDMPAGLGALHSHGDPLPPETVEAIRKYRLAIKGPTNTPKGEGFHSINVALRKMFDLYLGYRPVVSLPLPGEIGRRNVDILIYRQNTEGLYACKEVRTEGPNGARVQLSASFSEEAMIRLAERAFADAVRLGRSRVTLVTKSNIHKEWGRLYRDAFMKVASRHPKIAAEELLVDATSMKLQLQTRHFDMVVTENMFGDILSDLCAGMIGGLGLAAGANIGDDYVIYESVHGSADDIAGQNKANPVALILSAAMMLENTGFEQEAELIRSAIRSVISRGNCVTGDLLMFYPKGTKPCGTREFTDAVCAHI